MNEWENRYVLSLDLKMGSEGESLMVWGREFHSFGAVLEKARSPNVFSLDDGMMRVVEDEDRSERLGRWG